MYYNWVVFITCILCIKWKEISIIINRNYYNYYNNSYV